MTDSEFPAPKSGFVVTISWWSLTRTGPVSSTGRCSGRQWCWNATRLT